MSDERVMVFRTLAEWERAVFPEAVKRREREAETPAQAGERMARELLDSSGREA